MPAATELDFVLKRTFGYGTFRPLQREICETSLAGRDVFALLPTGGGKSLCFQLPALVRGDELITETGVGYRLRSTQ